MCPHVDASIVAQIVEEGVSLPEARPALREAGLRIPVEIHHPFQRSIPLAHYVM